MLQHVLPKYGRDALVHIFWLPNPDFDPVAVDRGSNGLTESQYGFLRVSQRHPSDTAYVLSVLQVIVRDEQRCPIFRVNAGNVRSGVYQKLYLTLDLKSLHLDVGVYVGMDVLEIPDDHRIMTMGSVLRYSTTTVESSYLSRLSCAITSSRFGPNTNW